MALDLASLLDSLCAVEPDRRPGSPGNDGAVDLVASVLRSGGWQVSTPQFPVVDWTASPGSVRLGDREWVLQPSPYGTGWSGSAPLHLAAAEADLAADHRGAVLLLHGELTATPLTPKGYPFYGSERDARVVAALESCGAVAVVAVTGRAPGLAGAVDPFPLIEDGAFVVPVGDLRRADGDEVIAAARACEDPVVVLELPARRWDASARNVIAVRGDQSDRITVVAHVDSKPGTPGAVDNAAGVVVLMRVAELLEDLPDDVRPGVELLAVNGEDHHAAPGEVDYLAHADLAAVRLAINIDAAGLRGTSTAFSGYGLPAGIDLDPLRQRGLVEGPPWPMSDHMVFAMAGRPAIALTSDALERVLDEVAHTPGDVPDLVDTALLEQAAQAVAAMVRSGS